MGYVSSVRQDEVQVRQVIDNLDFPAEVTSYELALEDDGDESAVLVTFQTTVPNGAPVAQLQAVAIRMNSFADHARAALIDVVPNRFPYFRFAAGH